MAHFSRKISPPPGRRNCFLRVSAAKIAEIDSGGGKSNSDSRLFECLVLEHEKNYWSGLEQRLESNQTMEKMLIGKKIKVVPNGLKWREN